MRWPILIAALWSFLPPVAVAGEIGRSAVFDHSTVRLLRGAFDGASWTAGVELVLPGDWKTYWKVPGEAGIPPDFDWSKSQNAGQVSVLWPAPKRYYDAAGESIGYKHRVVFPLTVTPVEASSPVRLHLKLFYAVCDDICVPGQAEVAAELSARDGVADEAGTIAAFAARSPAPTHDRITISDVSLADAGAAKPYLDVHVTGLAQDEQADVFVEGPPLAYFRKPSMQPVDDGARTYRLHIDGISSTAEFAGKDIEVVLVAPSAALVRKVRID